ncbi:response regulator [Flavobacterium terrae]|uniref:Two component transcriptional regulator, LuxR family n=1 Tax=Flavobacterium terrae TaxID=415425 RepID=A0A1M6ALZ8_9FLAO|nr:response regulator transcription factor [Flavobacterium terrae]SHI37358.1 two component transcriptional regulator, LuxR family [Flavobacterium terrae]
MSKFKISIVDDHKMFLNGLEAILKNFPDIQIIGTYSSPSLLLDDLKEKCPDLLITDISMPDINGIELMNKAKNICPKIKTMILSMHSEASMVKTILKEQPDGYLLKNTDQNELLIAITSIKSGNKYYSPGIQTILIDDIQGVKETNSSIIPVLSPREKEVLELIAKEYTTQEIANELYLSPNTVETYRQNLLRKLDAKNSAGIVAKAFQLGLL